MEDPRLGRGAERGKERGTMRGRTGRGKGEEKRQNPTCWIIEAQIDFNFEKKEITTESYMEMGALAHAAVIRDSAQRTIVRLRDEFVDGSFGNG